jgi:hypothetical protein
MLLTTMLLTSPGHLTQDGIPWQVLIGRTAYPPSYDQMTSQVGELFSSILWPETVIVHRQEPCAQYGHRPKCQSFNLMSPLSGPRELPRVPRRGEGPAAGHGACARHRDCRGAGGRGHGATEGTAAAAGKGRLGHVRIWLEWMGWWRLSLRGTSLGHDQRAWLEEEEV